MKLIYESAITGDVILIELSAEDTDQIMSLLMHSTDERTRLLVADIENAIAKEAGA
jgi:hypothetical protein